MNNGMEVERRWLLSALPERLVGRPCKHIVQGYTECSPTDLQLLASGPTECLLTITTPKDFPGFSNISWSVSAPFWVYEFLTLPKNQGKVRVRQIDGEEHFLTVKGEGSLARLEWEISVPLQVARFLFSRAEKRLIYKYRTEVPYEGRKLEFDVFNHTLTGLIILECEFPSADDINLDLPAWVGPAIEITADKRYSNKNLALYGLT